MGEDMGGNGACRDGIDERSLLHRLLNFVQMRDGISITDRTTDIRDPWIIPALRAIAGRKFDLTATTRGHYARGIVGMLLQRRNGGRLAADLRDSWIQGPTGAGVSIGNLFEYLWSDTDIWGIRVSPDSETGHIIVRSGTGPCLGSDTQQIKEALREPVTSGCVLRPDPKILERYDRRRLAARMLQGVGADVPEGAGADSATLEGGIRGWRSAADK